MHAHTHKTHTNTHTHQFNRHIRQQQSHTKYIWYFYTNKLQPRWKKENYMNEIKKNTYNYYSNTQHNTNTAESWVYIKVNYDTYIYIYKGKTDHYMHQPQRFHTDRPAGRGYDMWACWENVQKCPAKKPKLLEKLLPHTHTCTSDFL